MRPLQERLRKDNFHRGVEEETALTVLKEECVGKKILKPPDFNSKSILYTDASGFAVGAVLMQEYQSEECLIAWPSRKMLPREKKVSTT